LGELELRVHHPTGQEPPDTPPNERSVVFTLTWGEFDALFTGDVSDHVEVGLLSRLRPVELLKVGHHGSRTSTAPEFLAGVRPELSVISVGRRNRHGHPAPEVLSRLVASGSDVMRTDRLGRITIEARRDGSFSSRTSRAGARPGAD
jgi:competence protein ComEC